MPLTTALQGMHKMYPRANAMTGGDLFLNYLHGQGALPQSASKQRLQTMGKYSTLHTEHLDMQKKG